MLSTRMVALAFAFAVVSLAAASPPALERPLWTVGDYWTYQTGSSLIPGVNLTGTVTSTVSGRVPTAAAGATIDAWEVLVTGAGTAAGTVSTTKGPVQVNGTWIITGEQRFEPTGFQLVYNLLDLQANGTAQQILPFSARVQNTTSFEILANDWTYPLMPGSSGTVAARYNFTFDSYSTFFAPIHEQGAGEWNVTVSIGAPESIAANAGTFQAYPITEAWPDGSVERSFASPEVGNNVRTETYAPGGNRTAVTTLAAYRYQALEAPTYLGLTGLQWAIVAPVLAAAAAAIVVLRRRRRVKRRPPEGVPPPDPTSSPRGP